MWYKRMFSVSVLSAGAMIGGIGAALACVPPSAAAAEADRVPSLPIGTIIIHATRANRSDAAYANVHMWVAGKQLPGIILDSHGQGRFTGVPTNQVIQLLSQDPAVNQVGTYSTLKLINSAPVRTITIHEHR